MELAYDLRCDCNRWKTCKRILAKKTELVKASMAWRFFKTGLDIGVLRSVASVVLDTLWLPTSKNYI